MAYIDSGAYDKWRRQQEIARQTNEYNAQKAQLDQKYNGGGLGGFLGNIVGGIGKGIGDVGYALGGLFGTAGASVKDLLEGKAGTAENTKAFKRTYYGADSDKDAAAKAAGNALNAATTLATTAVPGLGAGSTAAKVLGGTVANTAAGALGGVADEFAQQGANASLESAANRAISGAAAGLATGGLNRKIGNATGKVGSVLLNNKLATSTLGRGALSGAVGGATGAGTSAALGGGDIAGAALQGGLTGAVSGATQAGVTSAAKNALTNARNRLWVTDIAGGMKPPKTATTQELQNIVNEQYGIEGAATPTAVRQDNQPKEQTKIVADTDNIDLDSNLTTTAEGQLRMKSRQALLDQYGTISTPVKKATKPYETIAAVADAGFTKPSDVERISNYVTGGKGKVSKLVSKLVATAKPVNTFDGIDALIDKTVKKSGLVEGQAKSVRNIIESEIASLPSRQEGSVSFTDNAEDVFAVVKALESRAADRRGQSGMNYKNPDPDRIDQAKVIDTIADELKDRIYKNAAPVNQVLTEDVRTDLLSAAPGNEQWANYVDKKIMSAKNIADLRTAQAPFVRMNKIITDGNDNRLTYGGRAGNFFSNVKNIPMALANAAVNSNVSKRIQAKAYEKAANQIRDNRVRQNTVDIPEATVIPQTTATAPTTPTTTNNPLSNFIGRTQGNIEANNAVQNARKAQDYQNLEDMFSTNMANIEAEYAPLRAMQAQQVSPAQAQLADISNGMNLALAAGDIKAYNQLADLYQTAYKMYELQNPQSKTSEMSTAEKNQIAKLESAGTALDELESLYKKAGGGQGIIGGNIANFLGGLGLNSDVNTYNQLAQGLINQIGAAIGKTDSLNTEGEVQRALSLVPKITDDNQTAMNKLSTLRQLLQTNTGTYNQLYGA